MSPPLVAASFAVWDLPRTCGDEPLGKGLGPVYEGSAPHLRG